MVTLLRRLQEEGLIKVRGRQRTDSTHVLAAVRGLNRLERVGETLRAALNELAAVAPAWLRDMAPVTWYERYGRRVENYRLPRSETARLALAAEIGADGQQLLAALDAATDRPELVQLPKVQVLRHVWPRSMSSRQSTCTWATRRSCRRLPSRSAPPTTRRHATAPSARWRGSATKPS